MFFLDLNNFWFPCNIVRVYKPVLTTKKNRFNSLYKY